ncbi:MAG: type I-E CRISPR-associated protein Cas6/Cse3/CasE [Cystobacterineae bacterium]|nr:type I-E CRISPR-associated protein Cas6/Cse3/CasE [Cystobacterineae bacterium]
MTRVVLKRVPPPNIIHGILSAAFPGERNRETNENLWRVDDLENSKELLIVSPNAPELQRIVREIGVLDARNKTLDYKPFLGRIDQGQTWNFRLCANPVEHKKQNRNGKRGKIYALRSVTEQLEWLDRKSAEHGFDVKGCSVAGDTWKVFDAVRIRAVTFEGLLAVDNAEKFRVALMKGIGRGKAYGCGLLTIARTQV